MNIQALVHCKQFSVDKVTFNLQPITLNNKPSWALWTSTWNDDIAMIPWIKFILDSDHWNLIDVEDCLYKVYIKDNVKLYIIDSIKDIENIPKLPSNQNAVNAALRYFQYMEDPVELATLKEFVINNKFLFDFQELANQGYDGLQVTDNMAKKSSSIKYYDKTPLLSIRCYDCESTVWFNTDCIDHVEKVDINLLTELIAISIKEDRPA